MEEETNHDSTTPDVAEDKNLISGTPRVTSANEVAKAVHNRDFTKEDLTEFLLRELDFYVTEDDTSASLDMRLKEDLDMDSLDVIEMLLSLEEKNDLMVDNTMMDFSEMLTVENLRDFIFERLNMVIEDIDEDDSMGGALLEGKLKAEEFSADFDGLDVGQDYSPPNKDEKSFKETKIYEKKSPSE